MNKLMLSAVFMLAFGTSAMAQIATDDPLHMCYVGGCSSFNGVTIDSSQQGGLSGFGVTSSPAPQTGQLIFAFLVPNNTIETVFPSLTGEFDGLGVGFQPDSPEGLFLTTQDLGSLFGGTTPPNPISAYQSATEALDPTWVPSDGYNVFLVDVNGNGVGKDVTITGSGQIPPPDNSFSISGGDYVGPAFIGAQGGLPEGTIITAFLNQGPNGVISTAQSSALVLGVSPTAVIPEPSTWVMMVVGFGLIGSIGWRLRRTSLV